jgi:hypothetical protein
MFCAVLLAVTLAGAALGADADPAAKRKPVFKCAGKVATKVGTPGRDIIRGTNKRDVIVALGGNDKIDGRGGHDLICAGPGNDLVIGGTGIDRIYGQAGRDRLYGGPGPDWLAGQLGNDRLNGGIGVDTCHQGPGAGLEVSCERPAPPPPTAPAPPDSDGDGVPDGRDACPTEGDRGWGLDATGCPVPPVAVTYVAMSLSTYRSVLTWSGLEPGSNLHVMFRYPGGSVTHNLGSFNGTGSGGPVVVPFTFSCATTPAVVAILATEAGGTEQEYAAPEPDISSLCP